MEDKIKLMKRVCYGGVPVMPLFIQPMKNSVVCTNMNIVLLGETKILYERNEYKSEYEINKAPCMLFSFMRATYC